MCEHCQLVRSHVFIELCSFWEQKQQASKTRDSPVSTPASGFGKQRFPCTSKGFPDRPPHSSGRSSRYVTLSKETGQAQRIQGLAAWQPGSRLRANPIRLLCKVGDSAFFPSVHLRQSAAIGDYVEAELAVKRCAVLFEGS